MTWQTILYFSSILLTCLLTGFLALYAWRQPPSPGVRAYAGLALSECLLALVEILSMVSGTQAQAYFWFNVRFLFTGIIPVLFLIFSLEYNGRKDWLSKPLLAVAFTIPTLSQVLLWSNSLHGLWVKQDVGFNKFGLFWIAETGQRIPGLWFMVHSFFSLILLLAGIVVILLTAWHKRRQYRGQALLLSAGALVGLATALIPVFNLLPHAEFNPFLPGIGISALLYALAVFRFQFLKRSPAQENVSQTSGDQVQENRSLAAFIFIFVLFASSIGAIGYVSFLKYETDFRDQVDRQLSAIAALKVSGLEDWRAERMADAEVLYNNPAFAALAQKALEDPDDMQAGEELLAWLDTVRNSYQYDRVFLLDTNGVERFSSPAAPEPVDAHLREDIAASIALGQVTFLDFHRESDSGKIHLALLVPVLAGQDRDRPLGLLVLRIDPETYLYPYLAQWPAASETAETLIVRREGEQVLFLNPLRFQPDAALNLRIPLTSTEILAVQAVLGRTGVVEGGDYRGQEVVGSLVSIPDSPWFLVARMDTAEVYAPLRERLWQTVIFFAALILAAGTGLVLVWRQQRVRYYRSQYETAESLRKSQEQYRDLIEHASDGIFIADGSGKYIEVNPSGCAMLGFTREEILAKRISDLVAPEDLAATPLRLEELRQGNTLLAERRLIRKDGSRLPVEISARMLPDGRFQSIQRDITERKQAEEKLGASEVRYRRLFEAARDGILILDAETGTVVDVNPYLVEMLGFSKEEFQGKSIWDLGFFKDILANQANFLELQQKEYIRYEDLPLETVDGRRIDVEFVSNIYQVDHRKVIQCNIRNITARKRANEILRAYSEHLEADVEQRTHELVEAQEKLLRQERLATLGQLSASVGHELRNPLGVISNAVYFLQMAQASASPKVKEYLAIIENETRTADKIVTDFLDYTRLQPADRERVAVSDLVRQTLERFPVPATVEVTVKLPARLPPVFADPRQMIQVLGNLVVNACQAMVSPTAGSTPGMPEGGRLFITASKKRDTIQIAMRDTGMGISSEIMKNLFEPLFTTKSKGIGLGLAVSKKLVEANGGRIEVQSAPGKGSVFTVYLPVLQETE